METNDTNFCDGKHIWFFRVVGHLWRKCVLKIDVQHVSVYAWADFCLQKDVYGFIIKHKHEHSESVNFRQCLDWVAGNNPARLETV